MSETEADKISDSSMPPKADAYLNALLRYTGEFYGAAIENGMNAGHAADCVAHVEKAARHLHQMATANTRPFDPAEFGFVLISDHVSAPRWRLITMIPDHEPCFWFIEETQGVIPGKWMQVFGDTSEHYYGRWPNSAASARIILEHLGVEVG